MHKEYTPHSLSATHTRPHTLIKSSTSLNSFFPNFGLASYANLLRYFCTKILSVFLLGIVYCDHFCWYRSVIIEQPVATAHLNPTNLDSQSGKFSISYPALCHPLDRDGEDSEASDLLSSGYRQKGAQSSLCGKWASSKALSKSGSITQNEPEIDFVLYYNVETQSLTVLLQRARYLPPKNHKCYLILIYLIPKTQSGDTLQSKVLEDSANPIINRSIVFNGVRPEEVRRQTLVFQLYNGSTMGDHIGSVSLPLYEADLYGMNCTMQIDMNREKVKVR